MEDMIDVISKIEKGNLINWSREFVWQTDKCKIHNKKSIGLVVKTPLETGLAHGFERGLLEDMKFLVFFFFVPVIFPLIISDEFPPVRSFFARLLRLSIMFGRF
jgi:hypothetical protein